MNRAKPGTALALAVLVAVLSWVGLSAWTRYGHDPVPVPWTAPVVIAFVAGLLLEAGRRVRRRLVGPLTCARTAVLAVACVHAGAVLAGWYLGQALELLPDLVGQRRSTFGLGLLGVLTATGLCVVGLVVQRWCALPPDEGTDEQDDR